MITFTISPEGVAHIQLDDGKANALTQSCIDEALQCIDRAENEAKVLCISGRAGRFCAGFDLKVMNKSPQDAVNLLAHGKDLFLRLYMCKLPVIMACTGHAVAGGALLLLCGDVRIGVDGEFKFGLNEVTLGMPIPLLGVELARDRLGNGFLSEGLLLGKMYSPQQARDVGYLDAVVPPEYFQTAVDKVAAQLLSINQFAHYETKRRLRGRTVAYIEDTFEEDLRAFSGPQKS